MLRELKTFKFKDQKIATFQNRLAEALVRRREMKEITRQLMDVRIQYKWNGVANLMVFHRGERLTAVSIVAGRDMLMCLGLERMKEDLMKGIKQRLELSAIQAKSSKIPGKR